MKPIIFAAFLLCLALNVRAQQTQQVDSALPGQWVRLNSGTTSLITTVSYPCQDTIWAGALLRSTDAGSSWQQIPHPGGEGLFQSSSEGILLGGGSTVYVTHDAGNTWDTVNTGIQVATFCWESPDTCFVIGGGGAYSTDGGLTWKASSFNAPIPTVNSVSFCNTKVGYTAGILAPGPFPYQNQMAGSCFKTTDGGATWTQIFTAIQYGLSGIAAISPDTVLVMVNNIGIYRTTDGGNIWGAQSPLFTFQNSAGESLTMRGDNGFVVGAAPAGAGYITHTTNAGVTWTQESDVNTPGHLYGVSILDDTEAIAVGDNGLILKRESGSSGVSQLQTSDSLVMQVFPNPSQGTINFQYTLPESQSVTLTISDATGNLVATPLQAVIQNSGLQSASMNTASIASGSYYYQLISAQYKANGSFIITK